MRSIACAASGLPAPRIVVMGVVFVTTETPFDLDARDGVHPAREQPGQVRQKGADTRVRTGIRQDVDPVGEQLAVARPAERELEPLAAAMRERDHALAPRLRPADGLPEVTGEPDDQRFLRAERALGAETAADVRGYHAQLTGLHAQCGRDAEVIAVRHLRGEPCRHAAVGVDLGRRRAHLQRAPGHSLADECVGDDDLAPLEEVLVVVHAARTAGDVRPHFREEKDLVLRRLDHVHHDGQRVVLDRHELGSVRARRPVRAQRRLRRCRRRSERRPSRRPGASFAARAPGSEAAPS